MKIIERYIAQELLIPFIVVIGILVGLFASFSSANLLAKGITESLGMTVMLELVLLKTLIAMEVLIPIALYVAVIVGLGRMYKDQEINALQSAGVGNGRIIRAVLLVAVPLGIISGGLSIFVRPWAYEKNYILNAQAEAELNTNRFQTGRFYGTEKSGRVIYIQAKDESGNIMQGVFHYIKKANGSEIIVANKGQQMKSGIDERSQIHLFDGSIYRLTHTLTKDTVTRFKKLIYFTNEENVLDYRRKTASISALMDSDQPGDIAERQWRFSRSIGTILLALIAVSFSRTSPRQGRNNKTFFLAALVYSTYYILHGLAQTWVTQGKVGSVPGVWWLYVLMFIVAFSFLSPGFWRQLFSRR